MESVQLVLNAAMFAAHKHATQKRKGAAAEPYINHLIEVAPHRVRVGPIEQRCIRCHAEARSHSREETPSRRESDTRITHKTKKREGREARTERALERRRAGALRWAGRWGPP